jgi:hypothetical protein
MVPVFVLDVARDLSLLSAAAAQMHAWHAPAPHQAPDSHHHHLDRHILTIKM